MLGDCAYGNNTELRDRLHDGGLQYVLSVAAATKVFAHVTDFSAAAPSRQSRRRPASRPRPDREAGVDRCANRPSRRGELFKTVTFHDGPEGKPVKSRFAFGACALRTMAPPRRTLGHGR